MITLNNLSPFALGYFIVFAAIIGLCIGSFSNVVILRGLSGESIVLPPSKCPQCHSKLRWYDNIPLLSYLFLGGKCRFCKAHISFQYPLIEATVAILYIWTLIKFDFSLTTLFMFAILPLFVIISATDLKEQVILVPHACILALFGFLYNGLVNKNFILPIIGIIAGFLTMEILARTGQLIFRKRAFGEGDSYIAAAIGAIVGWKVFLSSLILAIIIQAIMILPKFLYKLYKNGQKTLLFALFAFACNVLFILLFPKINFILYMFFCFSLLCLGLICIQQIFKSARLGELQTFPFGPAMLVSAFVFLFFKDYLTKFMF